jgi:CDP-4-dehydro-6-deoxyglucose reductase
MSHRVEIAETQQVFMVAPGESVLDAALRCGVSLAHECTFGGCGTCRVRVVDGAVTYEEFPMGLTEEEDAAGFALACQARPAGDLVISTARAAEPAIPARRTTATVQAITSLGPDVLHLRLALSDDEAFAFEPGQYLKILLEDGSHRSFSMASAPNGNTVDFHVRQIAGGRFTGPASATAAGRQARRRSPARQLQPAQGRLPAAADGGHRHRARADQEHARGTDG